MILVAIKKKANRSNKKHIGNMMNLHIDKDGCFIAFKNNN